MAPKRPNCSVFRGDCNEKFGNSPEAIEKFKLGGNMAILISDF